MDRRKKILQDILELSVRGCDLTREEVEDITEETEISDVMDSLDQIIVEMQLEQIYGISIGAPDNIRTYGDWVSLIEEKMK